MPNYLITVRQILEYTFTVEAEDEEEAKADAEEFDFDRWGVEPEVIQDEILSIEETEEEDD